MGFTADNQPPATSRRPRGRGKKSLMLQALRESTDHLGDELDYLKAVVRESLGYCRENEDGAIEWVPPNPVLMKEVISRIEPPLKSTMPILDIPISKKLTLLEKVDVIIDAILAGKIAPDTGTFCINAIKDHFDIREKVELEARIKALEEALGIINA